MSVGGAVFPARAGMSPVSRTASRTTGCVPRASGDEPELLSQATVKMKCSPRERG